MIVLLQDKNHTLEKKINEKMLFWQNCRRWNLSFSASSTVLSGFFLLLNWPAVKLRADYLSAFFF